MPTLAHLCPRRLRRRFVPYVMDIAEFDWVRVLRAVPLARLHRQHLRGQAAPAVGDLAWVSYAYRVQVPNEPLFIVECRGSDGSLRWLADLRASEIERVMQPGSSTASHARWAS